MAAADNASSSSKAADMLFVERGTSRFPFTRPKKAPFSDDHIPGVRNCTSAAVGGQAAPSLQLRDEGELQPPVFLDGRKLPPLAGTVFLHFHLGPKTVPKAVRCNSGGLHKGKFSFSKSCFRAFKNQKIQQIGGLDSILKETSRKGLGLRAEYSECVPSVTFAFFAS